MSRAIAAEILGGTGLPLVYMSWPDGSAPVYPCLVDESLGSSDFGADNINYSRWDSWRCSLYSEAKDDASEELLESALASAGISFSKDADVWLPDEALLVVSYQFTTKH